MLRDALIAFSWSNLCFVRLWSVMFSDGPSREFLTQFALPRLEYLAVITDVCLVAGLLWLALRRARRGLGSAAGWLAAAILGLAVAVLPPAFRGIIPWEVCRVRWLDLLASLHFRAVPLVVCGALCIPALWRFRRLAWRVLSVILLVLSPFVALTFVASILAMGNRSDFQDRGPAPRVAWNGGGPRVVWIIFDEWDQRLTFDGRPPGLNLPEIDRFRAGSLAATHAYSPGNATAVSIPALVSGRNVKATEFAGRDRLNVVFAGEERAVSWTSVPSLFSRAREAGFNAGAAGWYLPYCRLFGDLLAECSWCEIGSVSNSLGDGFWQMAANGLRTPLETSALSFFGQPLTSRKHADIYGRVTAAARRMAIDPTLSVAFLHLPIPHDPFIYDRASGTLTRKTPLDGGYADALVLADKTLGDLRRSMEIAGVWEQSAVLASSDHWFRGAVYLDGKEDHRVPFLLKLPHQREGAVFDAIFNTVLSQDLVLDILRGRVADAGAAARWLEMRRASAPRAALEIEARPSLKP